MPHKDPERAAEYQAEWRKKHPEYHRKWNKNNPRGVRLPPPLSRIQALREDIAQEQALAKLERRPKRVKDFIKRELQWIAVTPRFIVTSGSGDEDLGYFRTVV
jgi:hypothetical protein